MFGICFRKVVGMCAQFFTVKGVKLQMFLAMPAVDCVGPSVSGSNCLIPERGALGPKVLLCWKSLWVPAVFFLNLF